MKLRFKIADYRFKIADLKNLKSRIKTQKSKISPGSIPVKILFNPSVDKILDFRFQILDSRNLFSFFYFLFSEKTDKNLQSE